MKRKHKHPEFAEAMRYRDEDGTFQNERVKRSLLHRAAGYSYHSEKIFVSDGRVTRVPVVEHVPPSENAAKFWLQNRAPREWNAAHNVNLSSTLDVTITKDTSPKDAMAEFMKLLATPAAALVIEHEAIAPEPEPPGDANGSDWGGHAATEVRWRAKAGPDARFTPSAHPRGPAAS